jgi:hypothetical protein
VADVLCLFPGLGLGLILAGVLQLAAYQFLSGGVVARCVVSIQLQLSPGSQASPVCSRCMSGSVGHYWA